MDYMYILGVLIIKYTPVKTNQVIDKMTKNWESLLKSTAVGLIVYMLSPLVLLALMLLSFTGIGLPFFILGITAVTLGTLYASLWGDIAIGRELLKLAGKKDKQLYSSLLVGKLLRLVVYFIPVIRGIYLFVSGFAVIGAMICVKLDYVKKAKKK